jgi:hypothetical protein
MAGSRVGVPHHFFVRGMASIHMRCDRSILLVSCIARAPEKHYLVTHAFPIRNVRRTRLSWQAAAGIVARFLPLGFGMPDSYLSSAMASLGHQHFFVDVPALDSSDALSVHSFEVREALGEPYRIEVTLNHPDAHPRSERVGLYATFRMTPAEGEPCRFAGCITAWSRLRRTNDTYTYRAVIEPHVARLRHAHASTHTATKPRPSG